MNSSEKKDLRYYTVQKVTLVGALVNVVLAFAQVLGGLAAQSQALIADGLHTLSDLVTDIVVMVAAKLANKAPDADHPYGHERIETIATVILGLSLGGVAIGIALESVDRLQNPETLMQPGILAISLALFAILCKEGMYRYTYQAGKKVNSSLLKANAKHHRSDAVSSIMVAIGVTASVIFSIPWLDALAAMSVSAMIFYMGAKLILDSTMELVDTAWELEKVESMKAVIRQVPGVQSAHMLRTRKMSANVLVDVHIQVSPYISVSEGHHIAEQVMTALNTHYDEVSDITVHIDPEDDRVAKPSRDLPSRPEILAMLAPILEGAGLSDNTAKIVIHYVNGQAELEITLNHTIDSDALKAVKTQCEGLPVIREVAITQQLIALTSSRTE